jgi:NAD(P)-dependent dehydrogenase (short-subunit alcohol dehydrogenase family)
MMYSLVRFWLLSSSIVLRVGSFGAALLSSSPPQGLSYDAIAKLAQNRYQNGSDGAHCEDDKLPMTGKVVVITGAAGGIGRELSKSVHGLGGTVIALDRDFTGLEALQGALMKEDSDIIRRAGDDKEQLKDGKIQSDGERGKILIIQTNHEDLASVKAASEIITSRFGQVDILVNNAGMSYTGDAMISAQGKDLAFTVNYLSHFLLTEKLLQSLSNGGRIVHVTSTFHWKVDGSELVPDDVNGIPMAYQSDPELQSPKHVARSYANTKLAQLWHSRSISENLPSGVRCSSVCACPTWAATNIAGEELKKFLDRYAFQISDCGPGITSVLNGMLRTDEELGDALNDGKSFVANSRILEYLVVRKLLTSEFVSKTLGWRDTLADLLSIVLLFGQKYTHEDFIIQETSPDSFDDKGNRDKFYQWSKEEIKEWL